MYARLYRTTRCCPSTQISRRNLSHIVTMRLSVSRIVTDNATVVARINQGIDVCQVIPHHALLPVNPDLAAQHASAVLPGHVEPFVDGLSQPSHDLEYHICRRRLSPI